MQIRNPVYLADGRIDCEVKHPHFGWIPFTADPNDCEGHGREVHAAAIAMGPAPYVAPPAVDLATIRARRDQAIATGTVTVGDAPILTDDTTQQRLTAAALAVTLNPSATIRWKCADGCFRVLDAAQVIAMAQAVRAYVQACYDREAEMLAALDAGEPVDPDAGWP